MTSDSTNRDKARDHRVATASVVVMIAVAITLCLWRQPHVPSGTLELATITGRSSHLDKEPPPPLYSLDETVPARQLPPDFILLPPSSTLGSRQEALVQDLRETTEPRHTVTDEVQVEFPELWQPQELDDARTAIMSAEVLSSELVRAPFNESKTFLASLAILLTERSDPSTLDGSYSDWLKIVRDAIMNSELDDERLDCYVWAAFRRWEEFLDVVCNFDRPSYTASSLMYDYWAARQHQIFASLARTNQWIERLAFDGWITERAEPRSWSVVRFLRTRQRVIRPRAEDSVWPGVIHIHAVATDELVLSYDQSDNLVLVVASDALSTDLAYVMAEISAQPEQAVQLLDVFSPQLALGVTYLETVEADSKYVTTVRPVLGVRSWNHSNFSIGDDGVLFGRVERTGLDPPSEVSDDILVFVENEGCLFVFPKTRVRECAWYVVQQAGLLQATHYPVVESRIRSPVTCTWTN